MSAYNKLLSQDLFDTRADCLNFPNPDQIGLVYERARRVCQESGGFTETTGLLFSYTDFLFYFKGMTVEDLVKMRPRFWEFYRHRK